LRGLVVERGDLDIVDFDGVLARGWVDDLGLELLDGVDLDGVDLGGVDLAEARVESGERSGVELDFVGGGLVAGGVEVGDGS
jgi:hypothetical protein